MGVKERREIKRWRNRRGGVRRRWMERERERRRKRESGRREGVKEKGREITKVIPLMDECTL